MQKIEAKREKWDAGRKVKMASRHSGTRGGYPEHTRVLVAPRIRDLVHASNGISDPDQMIHSRS